MDHLLTLMNYIRTISIKRSWYVEGVDSTCNNDHHPPPPPRSTVHTHHPVTTVMSHWHAPWKWDLLSKFPSLKKSERQCQCNGESEFNPVPVQCWSSVCDAGPTLNQHCSEVCDSGATVTAENKTRHSGVVIKIRDDDRAGQRGEAGFTRAVYGAKTSRPPATRLKTYRVMIPVTAYYVPVDVALQPGPVFSA